MSLLNKSSLLCGLFVVVFLGPACYHETLRAASLVHPLWLLVFAAVFIVFLVQKQKQSKNALFFAIISCLGAFITLANGTSIGWMLMKIVYIFMGYTAFIFIKNNKMNLWPFSIFMVGLYIFFYVIYFKFILSGNFINKDEAFENSSSNAISICLCGTLFLYYLLNVYYEAKHDLIILLYSIINIILIFFQGSRGGLIVALLQGLFCVYSIIKGNSSRYVKWIGIGVFATVIITVVTYAAIIFDNMNVNEFMHLFESYDEESRSQLLIYAFDRMDLSVFLTGWTSGESLDYDHRTYNGFIDFWFSYGLLPFIALLYFAARRFISRKRFNIRAYHLMPLFAYSFAESFMAFGVWEFLMFLALFLSEKNTKYEYISNP